MNKITLQRSVQFLYEEHLARLELRALGCEDARRDEENPWQFQAHLNGNAQRMVERSAYAGWVDGEPTIYRELITPAYQGGLYNSTRSVNQYLTHWIYPYKGKFHPQMARALLNLIGAEPGCLILDPFIGSGTTAVESSLLGARCIGIDASAVCPLVTRVKACSYRSVDALRRRVRDLLIDRNLEPDDVDLATEDPEVAEFLQVAKLVTASDVSRRDREPGPWFRKNLQKMLQSVEAYSAAVERFGLKPGTVDALVGDARNLDASGVAPESVDGIVTSPPYSIALDYVTNDEHALQELGVHTDSLRNRMIGVRGKNASAKMKAYDLDMQDVFRQIARVLKTGAKAAVVIGDATAGGEEITTTTTMVGWGEEAGLRLERSIPKIVFGLYNVMQDERILIFRKE